MAPRREMHREAEASLARLEGRSTADRHHLLAVHRAFLSGKRQNDADFGDETRDTSAEGAEPVPASGIHRPPTEKTASYIEAAKQRMADRLDKRPRRRRRTARPARPIHQRRRVEESMAVARAEAAATLRSATRAKERERAALEGRRGADARKRAIADLKRKRPAEPTALSETTTATGAEKRKRKKTTTSCSLSSPAPGNSPARTSSHHVVDTTAEEDDLNTPDESSVDLPEQSQQPVIIHAATAQVQAPDYPDGRSTVESAEQGQDEVSRADATFDDEALNSDLDGESGADPD
ncbi:hypothetical protein GN958_ATG04341 [Phytophthora infestans]|uniref:Uncharacterized protein n=1 Tax=Phytophthora infestans TaxID=4787 RepID=A0A8S9UZB9_PHYIN|nr:hypothetical protein GN958_ATG04341 [Phytophthora infestans]